MLRPSLFIVSHHQPTTEALSKYIDAVGPAFIKHNFIPHAHSLTYSFIEEIHDFLIKYENVLINSAVIFDYTDGSKLSEQHLDPTKNGGSGNILGQLILAYPEIYWIIVGTDRNKPGIESNNVCWDEHFVSMANIGGCLGLLQNHQNGYRPIFDPSKLRSQIKLIVLNSNTKDEDETEIKNETRTLINKRLNGCAAALDEELAYSFLHAYTAYRFGYRSYIITSKAEMERLGLKERGILFSLEDLELKFPDMIGDVDEKKINGKLDDDGLDLRQKEYPFLPDNRTHRIIISGLHADLKSFPNRHTKPLAGIFDLYEKIKKIIGCESLLGQNNIDGPVSIRKLQWWEQFKFFVSNITGESEKTNGESNLSHSTTNKILTIGELLLERARKIAKEINTCPEAVYAATLSLEAKELLYGRSQTTSLEMYSLQQKMEVTGECCFLGIGQKIVYNERLKELAQTVDKILRINKSSIFKKIPQSYNAQLEIVNDIRMTFKNYEQFDEEDACIDKIRKLSQGLHFYNASGRKMLGSLVIEKYFNWLISSGKNIFWAITGIIFLFSIGYMFMTQTTSTSCSWDLKCLVSGFKVLLWDAFFDSLVRSAETFFSLQIYSSEILSLPIRYKCLWIFNVVSLFEMIVGYLHLGIFIAWLYQKLSRR